MPTNRDSLFSVFARKIPMPFILTPGLPPARNRRLPLAMGQPAWEALFLTIIPFSSVGAA